MRMSNTSKHDTGILIRFFIFLWLIFLPSWKRIQPTKIKVDPNPKYWFKLRSAVPKCYKLSSKFDPVPYILTPITEF
jgi:hypothetical protein